MNKSTILLGLGGLLLTSPAPAQDALDPGPLHLAPADTGLYIQVDRAAQWWLDAKNDPIVQQILPHTRLRRPPEAWLFIQAALGMTGDQVMRTYFGNTVALIVSEPGPHKPGVVVTEVQPSQAQLLRQRLELREVGMVGRFLTYSSRDDKSRFAFDDRWMIFSGGEHAGFFHGVLKNANAENGASLAGDPEFRQWVARLPQQRRAMLFARRPQRQEVHALAVVPKAGTRDFSVHYVGRSPASKDLVSKLGNAGPPWFPGLPIEDTIAALTLNVYDPRPADTAMLDRLLAPRDFKRDVLPLLSAPVVGFLGQVRGDQLDPDPGFRVPVLGLALKMKDPAVASDLDLVMDRLVLLANVATAKWGTEPVALSIQEHGGASYRVADVGAVLAQRARRPELKALKLAYGPVGDWYVLCTQDEFFRRCRAGAEGGRGFLDGAPIAADDPGASSPVPIGALVVRPGLLAEHLGTWVAHWGRVRPQLLDAATTQPSTPEGKLAKGVSILWPVAQQVQLLGLHVHQEGEDGIAARLDVLRPAAPGGFEVP